MNRLKSTRKNRVLNQYKIELKIQVLNSDARDFRQMQSRYITPRMKSIATLHYVAPFEGAIQTKGEIPRRIWVQKKRILYSQTIVGLGHLKKSEGVRVTSTSTK